jgi:hypothetical protein
MRPAAIAEHNRYLMERQRHFRIAADVVCDAWASFAEVEAVAVIGSVARALWKEVPRFREFRQERIEVGHECGDLDLALWLDHQQRLGALRRTARKASHAAYEAGIGISVVGHQLDIFLFEPSSDRYLGRLRSFARCPTNKPGCLVPGCGAVPFNKRIVEFTPNADLLAEASETTLYRRGVGRLCFALDLTMSASDRTARRRDVWRRWRGDLPVDSIWTIAASSEICRSL